MKLAYRIALVPIVLICMTLLAPARPAVAADDEMHMYRVYNPNSGEHLYTSSMDEVGNIVRLGWKYEGIGWNAPLTSSSPVYRLYNPNSGDHHYTLSVHERDVLSSIGWVYEGVGWHSDDSARVPLYRQFNPNAKIGTHNYTVGENEVAYLVGLGWCDEGVAWYACSEGGSPVASGSTPIMAPTFSDAASMAACYRASGHDYPSNVYANYGAPTIDDFCRIIVEEARDEGVSGDVVFSQAMLETGYLSFTGAVRPEMCNFCGLGANSSVPGSGNVFSTVREGLRAQVQHLKAYASTEDLVHDLVDQRFGYVSRGCAPCVEDLGGRWAEAGYGDKVVNVLNRLYQF